MKLGGVIIDGRYFYFKPKDFDCVDFYLAGQFIFGYH